MPNPTKADAAVAAAIPVASADRSRPLYHFHAPAQWMNDPNGPIFYKGWYHLFYQCNPYGDTWGHMHWGHARSKDMVHWEYLPIALHPSLNQGEQHVFSGSVFLDGTGRPLAFYTSIGEGREPEQWIAEAQDDNLVQWKKLPERVTQQVNGDHPIAEWRDPFLFRHIALTYMVTGGGLNGQGVVALYQPRNERLLQWRRVGVFFTHPDPDVKNIECPNIAIFDWRVVLLVSVHGRVESFVGRWVGRKLAVDSRGVLCEGSYASQLFRAGRDRTIQIAWVPTSGHVGWNGYLTLPSELRLTPDGTLLRTPVRELKTLRGEPIHIPDMPVSGEQTVAKAPDDQVELHLTLHAESGTVGVRVGGFEISFDADTRKMTCGDKSAELTAPETEHGVNLVIFRDRIATDVYAAGGAATFALALPVGKTWSDRVTVYGSGTGARVTGIVAYPLSLEHGKK